MRRWMTSPVCLLGAPGPPRQDPVSVMPSVTMKFPTQASGVSGPSILLWRDKSGSLFLFLQPTPLVQDCLVQLNHYHLALSPLSNLGQALPLTFFSSGVWLLLRVDFAIEAATTLTLFSEAKPQDGNI
ncbi:hypothetical protein VTL71DRAFT_1031 [Oculimacula yallundae]|uniref:Uncharacterized protein n=1 Tax=Oculimacula yallundae TaxID=86028 RepID=A0ABR4D368_9HELO